MIVVRKVLLVVSLVGSSAVIAEPLKGNVELGLVQTSGNSKTSNINFKLGLNKETENWVHAFNASALGSSSEDQDTGEDETTAEKYTADVKTERKLGERSFLYGAGTYEDDRFSGFEYQATASIGLGRKLIASETTTLSVEIGPGYRYNSVEGGPDEDEAIVRVGESLEWKMSETATLKQYVNVDAGDDNTIGKVGLSVTSALTGALALKVGIDAKYTENPGLVTRGIPPVQVEADDWDTETYANITYSF